MPNLSYLSENVAAAVNKTRLGSNDIHLMRKYASETSSDYCAGCTRICEAALSEPVPVGDVMRYLMYSRSYGDPARAKAEFGQINVRVRHRLGAVDYTEAEKRCPQDLRIGRLVAEALEELA